MVDNGRQESELGRGGFGGIMTEPDTIRSALFRANLAFSTRALSC